MNRSNALEPLGVTSHVIGSDPIANVTTMVWVVAGFGAAMALVLWSEREKKPRRRRS